MQIRALLGVLVFLALVTLLPVDVGAAPGRRGGSGGRSRGSSSGGGWFSRNRGSSSSRGYGGYGKKHKGMSTLKKAAVIGATAYGGYQLGKLASRFSGYHHGGWGFDEWNRWRRQDGFLCRNTDDCTWIDRNMYCQDYELDFQPSALWFGGDVARIVGECRCISNMAWNNYEMHCDTTFFGSLAMIAVLVVGLLIALCCCGACAFFFIRKAM